MNKLHKDDARDLELLVREHVEELIAAGAAKLMRANDLGVLVANLALNCFDITARPALAKPALQLATMYLLPEECRKAGIEVDNETLDLLRSSLGGA